MHTFSEPCPFCRTHQDEDEMPMARNNGNTAMWPDFCHVILVPTETDAISGMDWILISSQPVRIKRDRAPSTFPRLHGNERHVFSTHIAFEWTHVFFKAGADYPIRFFIIRVPNTNNLYYAYIKIS